MKIPAKETKLLRFLLRIAILLSVLLMAMQAVTELLPYSPDAVHDGQLACAANGAYFAVAPDGRLVAWGANNPEPHMSYDSEFPPTPFFARRTMMKNVNKVYATGRAVFALDNNGTLWRWKDTHGNGGYLSFRLPFTDSPEKMVENVMSFDKKAGAENDFVAVTEDGRLYACYQYSQAVALSAQAGLDALSAEPSDTGELCAVSARRAAEQNDHSHARLAVTLDGRLVWDEGSISLGGLSPKWRDTALGFFLAAVLLCWAEIKRRE